jgi:D-arginine dehydrogenase
MSPVLPSDADEAEVDVAIIGAGIVGASTAYFTSRLALPPGRAPLRVLLLEAEERPGLHSTGRSAALYAPSYGPPGVRALTRASRDFLFDPPEGFSAQPLLAPRGALFVASRERRPARDALLAMLQAEGAAVRALEGEAVRALVPVLEPAAADCGVLDEAALDMDVDALLQGFLRGARGAGVQAAVDARIRRIEPVDGRWRLHAADGRCWRAGQVVDAAGAWADEVAAAAGLPGSGVEPRRRTAFVFEGPAGQEAAAWPAVIDIDEHWYFKPDAGLLLGSPANADPVPPHDVVPEELDVAIGIDHIERATTLRIRRPRRAWAGLRSFVADGEPVIGPDPLAPGFVWAAAVGGYGIQSAPAVGRLCASWIARGAGLEAGFDAGVPAAALLPRRPSLGVA